MHKPKKQKLYNNLLGCGDLNRDRPVLMRAIPDRFRGLVWAQWYHPPSERWHHLFRNAPLRFAPGIAMDLVHGDVISGSIAFTGFWERRLSLDLLRLARRGGTMIDVGANLGYFSLLWAAVNEQNRCFAFEPSPRNVDLLRHNIGKNLCGSRIRVFPMAVGKENGRLDFDVGPPDQTGWGGFAAPRTSVTVTVNVVRIDETLEIEGTIALLKIDAEGADTWVLMGCEKLLRSRLIECIWFEQNRPRMQALGIRDGEAQEFLQRLGYIVTPRSDAAGEVVNWSAVPTHDLHRPTTA